MLVLPIPDIGKISFIDRWLIVRVKFKGRTLRDPESLMVNEAKLVDRDANVAIWLDSSGSIRVTNKTLKTITSVGRKTEINEVLKRVKLLEAN